jgi:putative inorganic carbon (HCO3(-)) transporter
MLYACLLLYITLIYVRPAEIVPGWERIPFVDILTVISFAIGIFSIAAKPRKIFDLPQDKLILAFWAMMVISSFKVWLTGVYIAFLAFMPIVFAYFLIRAGVQSRRQLRGLIYLLMALNVFLAVNGIVQYHTGVGLGNVGLVLDRIYGTGIFNDPNDLGMSFVMSVPLFLFAIGRAETGLVTRALSLAGLCAVLLALYYTNSRGAIVGLAAALVCLSLLRYKTVAGTIAAVALLGVIVVAAPSRGSEMDAGESSAQSRIQSWAEGWNMLKSHPITGVGFAQYVEYHIRVAHNSFVETFAELGLLGAFCFVGMFYWFFKGLNLLPQDTPESAAWRRALTSSAVGLLTCGWFLSRQYVHIFYIMIAVGACAVNLSVPEQDKATLRITPSGMAMVVALTIAGLVLVNISIRTLAIWGG